MTGTWRRPSVRELAVLLGILALAAVLRLPGIDQRGAWDADQGHDMLVLQALARDGEIPLLGPRTSIGTFHHGAVYYYLLAPAALLSMPIRWPSRPVALFGLGAVAGAWWLSRLLGGAIAELAALLMAVAGRDRASTFIWNPGDPFASAVAFAAALPPPVRPSPVVDPGGRQGDGRDAVASSGSWSCRRSSPGCSTCGDGGRQLARSSSRRARGSDYAGRLPAARGVRARQRLRRDARHPCLSRRAGRWGGRWRPHAHRARRLAVARVARRRHRHRPPRVRRAGRPRRRRAGGGRLARRPPARAPVRHLARHLRRLVDPTALAVAAPASPSSRRAC
jgi:hypothetical protein